MKSISRKSFLGIIPALLLAGLGSKAHGQTPFVDDLTIIAPNFAAVNSGAPGSGNAIGLNQNARLSVWDVYKGMDRKTDTWRLSDFEELAFLEEYSLGSRSRFDYMISVLFGAQGTYRLSPDLLIGAKYGINVGTGSPFGGPGALIGAAARYRDYAVEADFQPGDDKNVPQSVSVALRKLLPADGKDFFTSGIFKLPKFLAFQFDILTPAQASSEAIYMFHLGFGESFDSPI